MVKKRVSVSDLLQEEAQKFTPSEGESAIEVTAEAVTEQNEPVAEESPTPEQSTTVRRTTPTKADLEVTINELKESLEQSQKKEATLEKQVVDLQAAVAEQKALAKRMTKELDEAKKAAIHLAESNSQLIEEINSLKQEKESFTEANAKLVEQSKLEQSKQSSALKQQKPIYQPVKSGYHQDNYKKSYRTSERLATTQPDEYEDTSSQMWLLD
jgi:chromosome segregation ATPase